MKLRKRKTDILNILLSTRLFMDGESGDVYEAHMKLEDDLDLLSVQIQDAYIWHPIRLSVRMEITRKIEGKDEDCEQSRNTPNYDSVFRNYSSTFKKAIWTILSIVKYTLVKNPFLTPKKNILFIRSKTKKTEDGYWEEPYCDPIITGLDIDYAQLENPEHKKPTKTENIRYLDLINQLTTVYRGLGLYNPSFTPSEKRKIKKIEEAYESEFGVSVDIETKIKNYLIRRRPQKYLYKLVLQKINPKIVVGGGIKNKNVFVEACRECDIPVVELQHGAGYKGNPFYSHSEDTDPGACPDYYLTFGKFWKEICYHPLSEENIYSVGYPYLEEKKEKYAEVEKKKQVLFVSQPGIGIKLSRFAVDLAEEDDEYDVVYKLHPGEYDGWREDYPWLEDAPLKVADDAPPLYRLLAESEVQVGVNSTVIYEGLNFNLDTYLLESSALSTMEELIQTGAASVFLSVDELRSELKKDAEDNADLDTDYFFEPDPLENISEAFDDIIEREYQS